MDLHVPDGHEAVEPGVGRRLHDPPETILLDALEQLFSLGSDLLRIGLACDDGDVAFDRHRRRPALRQTEECRTVRDSRDEVPASLRGVGLELTRVHRISP